jgi:hypothetical protein
MHGLWRALQPWRRIAVAVLAAAAVLAVLALIPLTVHAQSAPEPGQPAVWTEPDNAGGARVHLYVFHSQSCPHCVAAMPFLEEQAAANPWLQLHTFEVSTSRQNAARYVDFADALGQQAMYVPAFFYCGAMLSGYDTAEGVGAQLMADLTACHEDAVARFGASAAAGPPLAGVEANAAGARPGGAVLGDAERAVAGAAVASGAGEGLPEGAPEAGAAAAGAKGADAVGAGAVGAGAAVAAGAAPAFVIPFVGEVAASSFSLPALTVVLAGLDAFNPCAFFVLMFLLSLMVHAKNRGRMLLIGGVFVLFSALIYFVFMAAWLNIFLLIGELAIITVIAGVVAVVLGAINVKDFFWFKQGVTLSIPESAKPGLFARMRKLVSAESLPAMLGGTVVLAVAANSYELLCTSGFPMVYTRALTLNTLSTAGFYGYLALYNLIYILPLLAIVVVFAMRFGSHKLSERDGRILKLLSGLMMLMLGVLLVFQPAALNNPVTAVGLLLGAVAVTWLLVTIDARRNPTSTRKGHRPHTAAMK